MTTKQTMKSKKTEEKKTYVVNQEIKIKQNE